jgi:phage FluMu protein Com
MNTTAVHHVMHEGMIQCPRCAYFNIFTARDEHPVVTNAARCHHCRLILPITGQIIDLPSIETIKELLS